MTAIAPPRAGSGLLSGQLCHDIARQYGLAPALTALDALAAPGTSVLGAGGVAVVPDADLGILGLAPTAVLRRVALPGGDVAVVRTGSGPDDPDPDLVTWAVWIRLGLSGSLLAACVTHLGGRVGGDAPLLQRQLVQGAIAEAAAGQLEVRALLAAAHGQPLSGATTAHLHAVLTEVDHTLLRLLGASGFLAGGPGEQADVSELLGGVHRPADEHEEDR